MAGTEAMNSSQGDRRSSLRTRAAIASCILMVLTLLVIVDPDARAATPELLLGRTKVGEYQPVQGETYLAWQQNTRQHPGHYDVFARPIAGGEKFRVNPGDTQGANGSIDGDLLVYQQFKRNRSDIKFFDLDARTRRPPPSGVNTGQWEYWPSFSGDWLLFARLYGNGARKMFLFDLSTGVSRRVDGVRSDRADLAPGQVSGDWAVWSKCPQRDRCDVIRYHIPDGTKVTIPNSGGRQYAPSVASDGTVFFARANARCGGSVKLVRRPPAGNETVLWRISSGDDIGTTRTFVDPNGVTTVLFDQFDCDQAIGSDAWAMGEDLTPQLSVTKSGDANGTVTSSPAGINCGNDCSETYASGTGVTLTAAPAQGASFAGWSGACTGITTTCTLTINGAKSVTATFTKKPILTVRMAGTGVGTVWLTPPGVNCSSDCQQPYDEGTTVTLTNSPAPGSTFGGWTGACGSTPCTVKMNSDNTVTALFQLVPTHTLMFSTTGGGTIDVTPPGTSCGAGCYEYAQDTHVTVTATPASPGGPVTWGDDCTGQIGNTCELTMDSDKIATFT